ncbi:MAG: hypothetical protein KUL82_12270 [Bdellovibrio sp.]|uniref:hypothetical protein n=1 Tax=Bdellovibrio sp. TaxID=28201 RepID=UPI0039E320FA|nr:hypothetical protein [Bdellovibrio sp.]
MKTKNMMSKVFKVIALVTMTLGLANCSKDNGNSTVTTSGYQMINNLCYQNINGALTQVNTSLCSNVNGSYQMINNLCYQVVNGQYIQQANTQMCMYNNYNNGYTTQVCNGPHTDGSQWVNCGTQFNCSGYTLYNQSGQIVRCQ